MNEPKPTPGGHAPATPSPQTGEPSVSRSQSLFEKHGATRKPGETRGRHPKDCRCGTCSASKAAGIVKDPGASPAANSAGGPPRVDTAACRQAISSFLKTWDGARVRSLHRAALKVSGDKAFANELAETAGLTTDEHDLIATNGAIVSEQYGLAAEHMPLLVFSITAGAYLWRQHVAQSVLKERLKEMNPARDGANPNQKKGNNDEKPSQPPKPRSGPVSNN